MKIQGISNEGMQRVAKLIRSQETEAVSQVDAFFEEYAAMHGELYIITDPAYGDPEEVTLDVFREMCDEQGWEFDPNALELTTEYLNPESFVKSGDWEAAVHRHMQPADAAELIAARDSDEGW